MRHYFDILGVQPGAAFEEVKRAYKFQVKKWHPDRFPSEARHLQKKAHERFQQISEAFQALEEHFKAHDSGRYSSDQPDAPFQKNRTEPGRSYEPDVDENSTASHSTTEHDSAAGFFTRQWPNGDRYEGQMMQEQMHGMGIYTSADGTTYTGQFRYGKPNGQGKLVYANGDSYTGDFVEDRMQGRGTYLYANGDRYIGQFQNDLPHGEGAHILTTGRVYAGIWENGYLVDPQG
jgi:curved DNA-binding protein CbpA